MVLFVLRCKHFLPEIDFILCGICKFGGCNFIVRKTYFFQLRNFTFTSTSFDLFEFGRKSSQIWKFLSIQKKLRKIFNSQDRFYKTKKFLAVPILTFILQY